MSESKSHRKRGEWFDLPPGWQDMIKGEIANVA